MLEKVNQVAEQAATHVSRRQFLGRFGRVATSAAAAAGGFLAFSNFAIGGRKPQGELCNVQSFFGCINHRVGEACGSRGRCTVFEGTDNECYCKERGRGPGRKR